MGKLVEGQWLTDDQVRTAELKEYASNQGRFQRGTAQLRNWITKNGEQGYKAETGRYHLFVAINCPWAHRTLIYRKIKKLEDVISLSIAAPIRTDQGWVFDNNSAQFKETLYNLNAMHELYVLSHPDYTGRVTVPVLWDKQTKTIVSNESSEIIRMFNSEFNDITGDQQDFYPESLSPEINTLNDTIFNNINNGVYKSGFARTQEAYDSAVTVLFETLDQMEDRLKHQKYLCGDQITEADWRFFPTLIRFDVGYYSAFKCNLKAIRDYPYLSAYLKDLYSWPGVSDTVDLDIYRAGYHSKSPLRNPYGIVPVGFESTLN